MSKDDTELLQPEFVFIKLGLNDRIDSKTPKQVKAERDKNIRKIAKKFKESSPDVSVWSSELGEL